MLRRHSSKSPPPSFRAPHQPEAPNASRKNSQCHPPACPPNRPRSATHHYHPRHPRTHRGSSDRHFLASRQHPPQAQSRLPCLQPTPQRERSPLPGDSKFHWQPPIRPKPNRLPNGCANRFLQRPPSRATLSKTATPKPPSRFLQKYQRALFLENHPRQPRQKPPLGRLLNTSHFLPYPARPRQHKRRFPRKLDKSSFSHQLALQLRPLFLAPDFFAQYLLLRFFPIHSLLAPKRLPGF